MTSGMPTSPLIFLVIIWPSIKRISLTHTHYIRINNYDNEYLKRDLF